MVFYLIRDAPGEERSVAAQREVRFAREVDCVGEVPCGARREGNEVMLRVVRGTSGADRSFSGRSPVLVSIVLRFLKKCRADPVFYKNNIRYPAPNSKSARGIFCPDYARKRAKTAQKRVSLSPTSSRTTAPAPTVTFVPIWNPLEIDD